MQFTEVQSFGFNDIDLYKIDHRSGRTTVEFISQRTIDNIVDDSKVKDQNVFSRYTYATQSNSANLR